MRVIQKEVRSVGGSVEDYYSVAQSGYVNVFAITTEGLVSIVRQFRPSVEAHTWELPAGLCDAGETPRTAAVRELREETGLNAIEIVRVAHSTWIPVA